MTTMLDRIQKMVHGKLPPQPIATLIGFPVTSIESGRAIVDLEAAERHANAVGTLHGGVLCDIADAAMGLAYGSTLGEGETVITLELKINVLRPVWGRKLQAIGAVVQRGRTIGLIECGILDDTGKLIARASSTCMSLRGDQALGR